MYIVNPSSLGRVFYFGSDIGGQRAPLSPNCGQFSLPKFPLDRPNAADDRETARRIWRPLQVRSALPNRLDQGLRPFCCSIATTAWGPSAPFWDEVLCRGIAAHKRRIWIGPIDYYVATPRRPCHPVLRGRLPQIRYYSPSSQLPEALPHVLRMAVAKMHCRLLQRPPQE